ncbi:MAG: hypothetical protein EOP87_00860 [Verrucomicrobiaceae bacterium]|nr:MAG: hypothetical protein EOP87_00860 [Verrucomicrobiaceae bacterium]
MDHPPPPQPATAARLRSVPYKTPYVWAQIFALSNYAGAVAVLTCLPILLLEPTPRNSKILAGSVAAYALTGLISFFNRRRVLCPLCKGTPLAGSRARIHPKARRIFPLDFATSALLSLLFSQTFCCMYCASRFDLLKPFPQPRKTVGADEPPENHS